jgi:proline racemase
MATYQVIDTHTAGHPTRAILGGLPPVRGASVLARRDDFRNRLDHLRPQLLHEPRGHAAMVGAILTESSQADFGAFFISSYVYLDMCGHATIGLARTLVASGQVAQGEEATSFTLETPAGVVTVGVSRAQDGAITASIRNVPARLEVPAKTVAVEGLGSIDLQIAYCGGRFVLVDAAALDLTIEPDRAGELCRKAAAIKAAVNADLSEPAGSVLFYRDAASGGAGSPQVRPLALRHRHQRAACRAPCGRGAGGGRDLHCRRHPRHPLCLPHRGGGRRRHRSPYRGGGLPQCILHSCRGGRRPAGGRVPVPVTP